MTKGSPTPGRRLDGALLGELAAGRTRAASYLQSFASDPRVGAQLARLARSPAEDLRCHALRAMQSVEHPTPEMLDVLIEAMRATGRAQEAAYAALEKLGPRARAVAPALIELARTEDDRCVRAL